MRDPMWRPGSIAGDANYFALDACFILPMAFLLVWRSRVPWERIFALGCLVATIASATLGASRGGFIAIGAAFLWLVWHSPRRLRNFIVVIILAMPPILLFPSSPVRRLIHPTYGDLNGVENRRIAWKAGLRMVERHPLIGIGLGEFKPQMDYYADPGVNFSSIAHNSYLEVAAETGLPNFLVFVAMLFFTYRSLSPVQSPGLGHGSSACISGSHGHAGRLRRISRGRLLSFIRIYEAVLAVDVFVHGIAFISPSANC